MNNPPTRVSATATRTLCTLLAMVGWSGLALQLDLVLLARWTSGASMLGGLVNYFSLS